jgi:AcrR family transcriptional regulator
MGRTYHHGNLRAALLEAAEESLDAGREVSLRELARQVGVSHAAPRRHFADKQALLDALAEDGFARLGGQMREAVSSAGSFEEQLLALARAYARFAVEHPALLEVMWAGQARVKSSGLAFRPPLRVVLEAQRAGEVVPGPPEEVTTVVVAALQGVAAMLANGMLAADDLEAIVPALVERLLLGLRPRPVE